MSVHGAYEDLVAARLVSSVKWMGFGNQNGGGVALSVVVPVYGCGPCVRHLHERLTAVLGEMGIAYEIVLVDDRSGDGSWPQIERLAEEDRQGRPADRLLAGCVPCVADLAEDLALAQQGVGVIVVEASDRATVERFNRADPFNVAGIWENVAITGFLRRQG